MSRINLGQALTILANLGVIVGILFLGFELRQTQDLARAQMRNDLTSETLEITRADINGPIAEILAKNRNGEPLTEAERTRFAIWQSMWNTHAENLYFQYQEGLYSQEALDRNLSSMLRAVSGFRDRVCRNDSSLNAGLKSYAQGLLAEPCQEQRQGE